MKKENQNNYAGTIIFLIVFFFMIETGGAVNVNNNVNYLMMFNPEERDTLENMKKMIREEVRGTDLDFEENDIWIAEIAEDFLLNFNINFILHGNAFWDDIWKSIDNGIWTHTWKLHFLASPGSHLEKAEEIFAILVKHFLSVVEEAGVDIYANMFRMGLYRKLYTFGVAQNIYKPVSTSRHVIYRLFGTGDWWRFFNVPAIFLGLFVFVFQIIAPIGVLIHFYSVVVIEHPYLHISGEALRSRFCPIQASENFVSGKILPAVVMGVTIYSVFLWVFVYLFGYFKQFTAGLQSQSISKCGLCLSLVIQLFSVVFCLLATTEMSFSQTNIWDEITGNFVSLFPVTLAASGDILSILNKILRSGEIKMQMLHNFITVGPRQPKQKKLLKTMSNFAGVIAILFMITLAFWQMYC